MQSEAEQFKATKPLATDSLTLARQKISNIDAQIHSLIESRCKLYDEIWSIKHERALPVRDSNREYHQLLEHAEKNQEMRVERMTEKAVLSSLMRVSRLYQYLKNYDSGERAEIVRMIEKASHELPNYKVVVNQGTHESYSAKAAGFLFKTGKLIHMKTFKNACVQVQNDIAPIAILPIENTSAGTVEEVYQLIDQMGLYIVAAVDLPIHHAICVVPGTKLSDIRQITSHPQALAQCSVFIKTMGWKERPTQNTAFATRDVAEIGDPALAALASKEAARSEGLDVLDVPVTNHQTNITRFVAVAKQLVIPDAANTLSLRLELPHQSGALADVLNMLSDYGLNVKKIQSQPVPNQDWRYAFYIDIEASPDQAEVLILLNAMSAEVSHIKLLGWYQTQRGSEVQ